MVSGLNWIELVFVEQSIGVVLTSGVVKKVRMYDYY